MSGSTFDPRREQLNGILAEMQENYEKGWKTQGAACCRRAAALLAALTADFPGEAELHGLLASMHYNLGNAHSEKHEYAEAEQEYRLALPIQQRLVREHPSEEDYQNHLARSHFNLGNVFLETRRCKEGVEEHRAAQKLWAALIERDPDPEYRHDLARSYFNLAYLLEGEGNPGGAQNSYHHAQAIWRELLAELPGEPPYQYDLARCCFNLGVSLHQTGKPQDALETLREGRTLFEDLAERWPTAFEYNRDLLQLLGHMRLLCKALGRFEEARETHEQASALHLRMLREFAGEREMWNALGRSHLEMAGWYRDVMGRREEAERACLAAQAVFEEMARLHPGPDVQHKLGCILFDLGMDCRETDRPDQSEEYYRRALALWEELARTHPEEPAYQNQLAACHNNLGILYHATSRLDRAEQHCRQAIFLRETWLQKHPDDSASMTYLGGALCNLGNVALARRLFRTAHGWYSRSVQLLEEVRQKQGPAELNDAFLRNALDGEERTRTRDDEQDWRGEIAFAALSARPAGPPPRLLDHGIEFPDEAGLEQFVSGDTPRALKMINKRIAREPDNLAARFWKARLHVRLGEHEAALEAFEHVLELLPAHAPACHDRADVLRFLNRPAEALEAAGRLIAWDEADADAWHLRGLILGGFLDDGEHGPEPFSRERVEEAVEAFDRALLLQKDFYEARLYKARAMQRISQSLEAHRRAVYNMLAGRMSGEEFRECLLPLEQELQCWFRRSVESLEAASRLQPKAAEPWYGLAQLYDSHGGEENARRCLGRAIELDPELRPRAKQEFGWFERL